MARPQAEASGLRALLWASEAIQAAELDAGGVIADANPAMRRDRAGGLEGTAVGDLLARGQHRALLQAIAAATAEEWSSLTLTFLGPGGEASDDRAVRLLRTGDRVLMVAEPARADREDLVEQVLELNDELVAAQRSLGRRQREVERSRAEAEAATRRAAQLEAITFTGLSRPEAVAELLEIAREILGGDGATLTMVEDDGRALRVRAAVGRASEREPDLAAAVASSGRPRLQGASLAVPLVLDGAVAGVLQVESDRPGAFTEEDLRLLEAVGERAALVIGHAQLRERERRISETLQRTLLPQRLPDVGGLTLAARYRPQVHAVHVGGDFYDAMVLDGGEVSLAIGDVAGKGLRAAALMGHLRSALRAYALDGRSPGEVLDRLDRLVVEAEEFATALHLVLDPLTGAARLCTAGHPPLLRRSPTGEVAFAAIGAAAPLGVGWRERPEHSLTVGPDETLVLYTDGLFERRGTDPEDRLAALRAATADAPEELGALLDHLIAALAGDGYGDDVALLAVRRDAG